MTDRDVQNAPIKWKVQRARFVMEGGFVALIDRDGPVRLHRLQRPCREHGGPPEHMPGEPWATVWGLEGDTLEEARQALAESRFRGAAYRLSDCQLLDDRPGG